MGNGSWNMEHGTRTNWFLWKCHLIIIIMRMKQLTNQYKLSIRKLLWILWTTSRCCCRACSSDFDCFLHQKIPGWDYFSPRLLALILPKPLYNNSQNEKCFIWKKLQPIILYSTRSINGWHSNKYSLLWMCLDRKSSNTCSNIKLPINETLIKRHLYKSANLSLQTVFVLLQITTVINYSLWTLNIKYIEYRAFASSINIMFTHHCHWPCTLKTHELMCYYWGNIEVLTIRYSLFNVKVSR